MFWDNIPSSPLEYHNLSPDTDLEGKLNFLDQLKCLKDVVKTWEHRGLSLAGKIFIFKSLALSKLLYASAMKCQSRQILDQINLMRKNFVWNDKIPKIKHSTLISALKVSWLTRLLDDNFHHWKVIPNLLFLDVGGLKTIFHYNLKLSKYCRQKVSRFLKFHYELVQIWSKVSDKEPSQAYDISNEVLWNNCITARAYSMKIILLYFIARGMLTIQDITNENGSLLSWEEAQHKFSLNNSQILHWIGIIKCIPKSWRTKLYSTPDNIRLANQLRPDMLIVTSKSAYIKLLKSITSPPSSQTSLANLDDVDWRKIYLLPRQTTIKSSLRSFQYKIVTNTLCLNERLLRFGIAESPPCSQCTHEKESIIHLFVTCRVTHNLWEQLCAWLSGQDIKLPLSFLYWAYGTKNWKIAA